ncbi:hypothetical protein [Caldilinea sp.]|uniref:hypothetical protein n=1 Tax=Caldilinea sp. TaxID=2293560 RepID=UPI001B1EABD3|nr:hypothetical protein [Caldilinea sp.]MBO9345641.1 hypothetical protein [Chloroflexota bacterium]MBO9394814.1 hypothetical protein [Caldilinea sp.]
MLLSLFTFDVEQIKRTILNGPIGLYVSMCIAYALLCATIAASTVHDLLEDGKHLLRSYRLDLHLELKALVVLCHEQLGQHRLPSADFIPETAQLDDRVIGWFPACAKSAWPGPAAVPRAP